MSSIDSSHPLIPESGGDRPSTSRTSRPTELIDTGQLPLNDSSEMVRQSLPSSRTNLPVTTHSQGSVVNGTENKLVEHTKKMGAAVVKGVINISKWISQNKVLTAGVLGGVGILLLASGYGAPVGICLLIAAVALPALAHVIANHAKEGNNEQMQNAATRATQDHAEALDQHSRTPRQITSQSNPSPRLDGPPARTVQDDDEEWEERALKLQRFANRDEDHETHVTGGPSNSIPRDNPNASSSAPLPSPSTAPPVGPLQPRRRAPPIPSSSPRQATRASPSSSLHTDGAIGPTSISSQDNANVEQTQRGSSPRRRNLISREESDNPDG